ncbi:hypothetical protein P171DRAFT_436089 [Karstenula rhodostoma CBS 690.94]|uniref:Uncharacterized protein n=1 Tax=Karstenula rhodostoma CBS 690.94 TaxID=1392251 RepID=A0A9P4U7R4_9PLEO|nr:hypothetical protein P171DRAFT_436089 [Karstenula rhodostoma CBS 690.94]
MTRHCSHRASVDQAKNRHHEERYDRRHDHYEPTRPARRWPSGGDYRFSSSSCGSSSSRRSSDCFSRRESASGGFLARRSIPISRSNSVSSPSSDRSSYTTQRSDWEAEMNSYFDALKGDVSFTQDLDPIVNNPDVRHDREARGSLHRSELVANQFDVTLKHVRDLLQHMLRKYNTVTCYSVGLLKPGDIIYYIEPFVLGFDQDIEGESASVLGGSRFQAAVQAKGRFGIVTRTIGRRTLKVAPMYTFNGDGLASKPLSIHDEYIELGRPGQFTWGWTKPKISPVIEKEFCLMKPGSAVHLITTKVTLTSQVLMAGSITPSSLEWLRSAIILAEESADW